MRMLRTLNLELRLYPLDNGEIVLGSNQENAAYPSGLCAERVAIFMQVPFIQQQNFENGNTAASDTNQTTTPIPPCGSCE
jgi:cytidine deaminase